MDSPIAVTYSLASILTSERLTAKQIAARLGCSKPTAYARLVDLRRDPPTALKLSTIRVREGKTGPTSKAYQLVSAA